MSEWQPIENAPYQKVIWVKNDHMEEPVKATRGYSNGGVVNPDNTLFTTVYTEDKFFPTPAGRLVCPTKWKPVE